MERLDGIVAGIGILVIAVALAGVVTSGPGHAEDSFRVVFQERRTALPALEAAVQGDGDAHVELPVAVANLTTLEFTVTVRGDGPRAAADDIEVTVESPDGMVSDPQRGTLAAPAAGAATVSFRVPVGSTPAERSVRAGSAGEALGSPEVAGLATAAGTGTWTVHVRITAQDPVGALGAAHTEAHTISVEATALHYEAVVLPQPANPR